MMAIWRVRFIALVWLAVSSTLSCADDGEGQWSAVFSDLPGALVSVWGSSATDVWTVGSDDGSGPLVLHYNGTKWQRKHTGVTADLWWVFGLDGAVFMGGSGGTILQYAGGIFTTMPTPVSGTVFGIWGTSASDLWAVGGNQQSGTGFILRNNGAGWTQVTDPAVNGTQSSFFKVWGRSASEVFIVGTGGVILRYDGATYIPQSSPTALSLFTIAGVSSAGGPVAAVGGAGNLGVVAEYDEATGWHEVEVDGDVPAVFGVAFDANERAFAVGFNGQVVRRDDGAWRVEDTGLMVGWHYHAVWIDPDGGVWTVGGRVIAPPLTDGMLSYKGFSPPPTTYYN